MRKFLLTLLAAVMLAVPATAGEHKRFELVIGSSAVDGEGVNGAEVDSRADVYSGRFMQDFGESGYFAGGLNLERIELTDVDGGAWCVDAVARIQRNTGQIRAYLGGALGGVFTDVSEATASQEVGLRASGIAGVQFYFTNAQRFGFGAEYAYSKPLGDGFLVDEDRGGRVFLILPAEAAPAVDAGM